MGLTTAARQQKLSTKGTRMSESPAAAQEVWEQVLEALGKKAARPSFESSVKQVRPRSIDEECLELMVATEFARDWLDKRGRKAIESALAQVTGRALKVKFELGQMGLDLDGKTESARRRPSRSRLPARESDTLASTPLNPKYTFESFVVGKSNQFAEAAALAVARNPAKSYNPLFLYGGVGLGKTHLMQAIGHHVAWEHPHLRVEYVSGDTFTFHVVSSIRDDQFGAFRRKYHEVDLWLVDDIQFIAAKERTESEFFQVFNTLYETGRQVVITSDRPPKELQVMDDRLRSRFEWGLIADIKPPDLETRIAILGRKAQRGDGGAGRGDPLHRPDGEVEHPGAGGRAHPGAGGGIADGGRDHTLAGSRAAAGSFAGHRGAAAEHCAGAAARGVALQLLGLGTDGADAEAGCRAGAADSDVPLP